MAALSKIIVSFLSVFSSFSLCFVFSSYSEDCCLLPEEAGNLEAEDQSERKREEKLRARGPEGQRPLIPSKVCVYTIFK